MRLSREIHLRAFILFTTFPFGKSQSILNNSVTFPGDVIVPITWQAPRPLKFQHWFPAFGSYFLYISQEVCNLTLLAYEGSLSVREQTPRAGGGGYCGGHVSCVLSATTQAVQANMAATTVLLGLTPSILAGLGPTVGEVALLSLHRPVLALLISLGAPGIYPTRIATYDNPFEAFETKTGALVVPTLSWPHSGITSAAQYALTASAAVNVFKVSYDIGVGSVLAWWCEFSLMPLLWSALTVVVHLTAAFALRVSRGKYKQQESPQKSKTPKALWASLTEFARREGTLSGNDSSFRGVDEISIGPVGTGLNLLAGWLGLCHLAFGTCIFAGVVFISTGDAAFLILRYLASGTICRLVLYFELGGMRKVGEGRKNIRWIVQPEKTKGEGSHEASVAGGQR